MKNACINSLRHKRLLQARHAAGSVQSEHGATWRATGVHRKRAFRQETLLAVQETVLVASSSKIVRLEAALVRCVGLARRLGEELATKDATIAHLQEQLARAQEQQGTAGAARLQPDHGS